MGKKKKKAKKRWSAALHCDDTRHAMSYLVLHGPLPSSSDGGAVGCELSHVMNLSVVLQGRDSGSVDVHDSIQGAVVLRLLWQSDVGLPEEDGPKGEGSTASRKEMFLQQGCPV